MKPANLITIIIISLFSISEIFSQTAVEIIKKSEDQLKGSTSHGTYTMTIETPDFTRTLKLESWNVGNEKALIKVKYPKKEAGIL